MKESSLLCNPFQRFFGLFVVVVVVVFYLCEYLN